MDVAKTLETRRKWSSKLTGNMVAGVGLFAYLARAAVGSGANLVCTCFHLTLLYMSDNNIPIGAKAVFEIDNTVGENKCDTTISYVSDLVQQETAPRHHLLPHYSTPLPTHTHTHPTHTHTHPHTHPPTPNLNPVHTLLIDCCSRTLLSPA